MKKAAKCSKCGLLVEKDGNKDNCIKCKAPSSKFIDLTNEESNKIYSSDRTNDIFMEISTLAMQINKLCDEGKEINLDDGCQNVFGIIKDMAWDTKQLCKAEMSVHVNKGKW